MFIKGFTYGFDGKRGDYRTKEASASMERLAALGGDWTALAFVVKQDSFSSTVISPDYRYTVTDKDVAAAVDKLHALGLKVCMKPMVNCADGVWRAHIHFPEVEIGDKDYWKEWFSSYTAFLCHYAEIAEETGCEMFCVGCEMLGTEHREDYWRRAIEEVRKIYHGPITYNTNHGKEFGVKWWDAVDYIGTSAYYGVGKVPGDSLENTSAIEPDSSITATRLLILRSTSLILRLRAFCSSLPLSEFSRTSVLYCSITAGIRSLSKITSDNRFSTNLSRESRLILSISSQRIICVIIGRFSLIPLVV